LSRSRSWSPLADPAASRSARIFACSCSSIIAKSSGELFARGFDEPRLLAERDVIRDMNVASKLVLILVADPRESLARQIADRANVLRIHQAPGS
jgi:hypothetical protein